MYILIAWIGYVVIYAFNFVVVPGIILWFLFRCFGNRRPVGLLGTVLASAAATYCFVLYGVGPIGLAWECATSCDESVFAPVRDPERVIVVSSTTCGPVCGYLVLAPGVERVELEEKHWYGPPDSGELKQTFTAVTLLPETQRDCKYWPPLSVRTQLRYRSSKRSGGYLCFAFEDLPTPSADTRVTIDRNVVLDGLYGHLSTFEVTIFDVESGERLSHYKRAELVSKYRPISILPTVIWWHGKPHLYSSQELEEYYGPGWSDDLDRFLDRAFTFSADRDAQRHYLDSIALPFRN